MGLSRGGGEFIFKSFSLEDTARLAGMIAAQAQAGTVIALDGDLGAGKTAFSQALARAIGVARTVNSPTFTIIKEYDGATLPFYHMDVYRISLEEAEELGLHDYFYGDGITVVEWASRIQPLLPKEHLTLLIENDDATAGGARTFRISPLGQPYLAWCEQWKADGAIE